MGTEKDFKVKKGLTVTDNISVSGDIDVSSLYGRLNFKKNADGNVNNDAIFFINGSDQYAGAVKYFHSTNTLRFDANQATQLHIADGSIYPPVDNDVDLGTSSLKFKDSFFGLVDAENFKINGGQGSDGQVLTSTGSGVAWEDAASGGASAIGGLDDVLMDATNFVDGILIQTDSNGSAPTTGTLSSATGNLGIGKDVFEDLTSGTYNVGIGYEVMKQLTNASYHVGIGYKAMSNIGQTGGSGSVAIGKNAMLNATSGGQQIAIGEDAMGAGGTNGGSQNIAIGWEAGKVIDNADYNTFIGTKAGKSNTSGSRNIAIGVNSYDAADTENDNIAIGYDALGGSVAGGEKNVMIGNYAGDSITSGFDNVGIGYLAHTGGTGFYNVAVGSEAGKAMTANSYQTLVGYQAGQSFNGTNARFNTAVGYQAMGGGTSSPHQNTALGAGALYNVNGVSRNNIGIGYQSGVNQTAGSGNIIIGSGIDLPSTSGSRQLKIAGNDGGTTTTWITGDSNGGLVLGKEGAGVVQVGDSSLNPSGINLGKFIVSRDDSGSSPAGPTMSLVDSDDDANAGPILKMYRNTASPADDDALGVISFNGEDSVGGERGYVRIRAISDNVTSGSNSGSLEFRIFANGTQAEVMQLEPDAQAGAKMTLMGVSQTGAVVSGASTANNAYLNLLTVAHGTHKAITASAHITDSTNNEVQTEMIVAHYDGSAVNYTTYGQIFDGAAAIGALEANLSGSNIIIQFKNTQGSTATIAGSIHATMHP